MIDNKLLAVIVLYYPDFEEVKKTVADISQSYDVLLIDNTDKQPRHYSTKIDEMLSHAESANYINNQDNLGLSRAFNIAGQYAIDNNYRFLLTLDQDSLIDTRSINAQHDCILTSEDIALVGPKVAYTNSRKNLHDNVDADCVEVDWVISSGSIIRVKAFDSVGGFDERYFIDGVDFEFCSRLRKSGYKILVCASALLRQTLGTDKKILGSVISLKSTPRYYYTARNKFLTKSFRPSYRLIWLVAALLRLFIHILFFEERKACKLRALFEGVWDGVNGKFRKKM